MDGLLSRGRVLRTLALAATGAAVGRAGIPARQRVYGHAAGAGR